MAAVKKAAFTEDEVALHNKASDCWIILGSKATGGAKVYDVTKYLPNHPGGPEIIMEFAGKNADDMFEDIGHSDVARKKLTKFLVGSLIERDPTENRFLKACQDNDIVETRRCLAEGIDINCTSKNKQWRGCTPLQVASEKGHLHIVELLLGTGANVNKPSDTSGETALHYACKRGHLAVVRHILNFEANINATDNNRNCPLHCASENNYLEVLELLLNLGADVRAADKNGCTPLHVASAAGYLSIAESLLNSGADTRSRTWEHATPLHLACWEGQLLVAELLLDRGADATAIGKEGITCIHLACLKGHLSIVELLISWGVDLDAPNEVFGTALVAACGAGHQSIAALLLNRGANVMATTSDGGTALHVACGQANWAIAELLLSKGADVARVMKDGKTPLELVKDPLMRKKLEKMASDSRGSGKLSTSSNSACSASSGLIAERSKIKLLMDGLGVSKSIATRLANQCTSVKDCAEYYYLNPQLFQDSQAEAEICTPNRQCLPKQNDHKIPKTDQSQVPSQLAVGEIDSRERLQKELRQMAATCREQESQNGHLNAQLQKMSADAIARDKELTQCSARLQAAEARADQLHQQKQQLQSSNDELVKQLQQSQRSIADLTEQLRQLNSLNVESTQQLQQLQGSNADLAKLLQEAITKEQLQQKQFDRVIEERVSKEISQRMSISSASNDSNVIQIIPSTEVELGDKLGEGGFGEVFAGAWAYQPVAVKRCRIALPEREQREIRAELETMYHLQHRHVVRLFGMCPGEGQGGLTMIVMEYGARGSLFDLLHNTCELDWALRLRLCEELSSGLAYLHMKKVIHRDIKSLNVVLDEDLHAKWCDFGLAVLKRTGTAASIRGSQAGTANWMAPELLDVEASVVSYSSKSDVWALGMLFFEIASRKLPFQNLSNMQMMFRIAQGRAESVPEECRTRVPALAELMERCWCLDRSERPTAAAALEVLKRTRSELFLAGNKVNSSNGSSLATSCKPATMRRGNREDDLKAIATVRYTHAIQFNAFIPTMSCADYLRNELGHLMPQVDANRLIQDCVGIAQDRLNALPPNIAQLSTDEAVAVVAYTFNADPTQQERNLFYVLNQLLRERNGPTIERLRPYLCYLLKGLSKLPVYEGLVYRGLPVDALPVIKDNYKAGHAIQWSALTSTTTEETVAKSEDFAGMGGIVFHIRVRSGRRVTAYSAFPDEAEVVLSPNAKFVVSCPCELLSDGYYKVELVEQADSTFVF